MRGKIICIIALLSVCAISKAAIVIDDFSGSWTLKPTALGVPVTKSETDLAGVYGGSRETEYIVDEHSVVGASLDMSDGYLVMCNGPLNWGKATLTYDANDTGLNLDLTTGTKISLDAIFEHVGLQKETILSVTLNDGTNTATAIKRWMSYQTFSAPITLDFLFTEFLNEAPALDLSSIYSISMCLESDFAGDYIMFNGITTDAVPEPATMALLSLGGFLFVKRKKI